MHWQEAADWWHAKTSGLSAPIGSTRKACERDGEQSLSTVATISNRADFKEAMRNVEPGSRATFNVKLSRLARRDTQGASCVMDSTGIPSVEPSTVVPGAEGQNEKGRQVKLQKPMLILGQIQQVTEQTMTDKKDASKSSKMFLIVFADKTKPAQFRTSTPFCTFLTEEKFRAQFGAVAESAVDEMITMAVSEIAPYNAFMKVKGQLLKGHQTGEHLAKMQADAAAEKAAPAPASKSKS